MGVRGWDEDGGWGLGILRRCFVVFFGRTSRFRGMGLCFFECGMKPHGWKMVLVTG